MKALTVCQPWAWATMTGIKLFENRTWHTSYTGPLLIHAGKSLRFMPAGLRYLYDLGIVPPHALDFGMLLGRVDLVDCQRPQAITPEYPLDSAFIEGPFCLVLEKPRNLIDPIPYTGKQGIFEVPDRLLQRARWEPQCRVCGCTSGRACEEGCSWVTEDLCSACVEKMEEAK